MRSTLVSLTILSTLLAACGKEAANDTKASASDASAEGSGGMSETGVDATAGSTSANPPTTTVDPDTGEAETAGTTGTDFIIKPDGGGVGVKECSNWDQDCPADQKCMPWADGGGTAWNATKCVPVDPAKGQPGDSCTTMNGAVSGFDTCDLGVMCWDVKPDTMMGTCVAQCTGSEAAPMCGQETSCFVSNDGVLNLCLPLCDPLAQDCANENLCIPNPQNNEVFTCVLDASGDEGQTFDPCEFVNACDKGFLCANVALGTECMVAAKGCCLPFCDTADDPVMCPGAGQECIPWYEMGTAPPGFEQVGICGIPMG
jgi:hypothetical protein